MTARSTADPWAPVRGQRRDHPDSTLRTQHDQGEDDQVDGDTDSAGSADSADIQETS